MRDMITLLVDPEHPDILVFIASAPVHYSHGRGATQVKTREANTATYVRELQELGLDDAFIDRYRTTTGYVSDGRERNEVIKLVVDRISRDMSLGEVQALPVDMIEADLSHHVRESVSIAA